MIQTLLNLPRKTKHFMYLFFDAIAVIGCLLVSFLILFGDWFFLTENTILMVSILAAPIIALPTFTIFGIYRDVIRFMGLQSLWRIAQATSLYAILWGLIIFIASVDQISHSLVLVNWLLVIIVISGSRLIIRWLLADKIVNNNIIIYGAGEAGRQLSIVLNECSEYKPVAFIDDDNTFRHSINGLIIYPLDNLEYSLILLFIQSR